MLIFHFANSSFTMGIFTSNADVATLTNLNYLPEVMFGNDLDEVIKPFFNGRPNSLPKSCSNPSVSFGNCATVGRPLLGFTDALSEVIYQKLRWIVVVTCLGWWFQTFFP